MLRISSTSHCPRKCMEALAGAEVAIIDLETTGLYRHNRIVAAGVLVGTQAFVLPTGSHRDISSITYRVSEAQLIEALSPLYTRSNLTVVFHNAIFDAGMLRRIGLQIRCRIHDTQKLLKLHDSDRGPDGDDGSTRVTRTRRGFEETTNYRLKTVARHILKLNPIDFPHNVSSLPFDELSRYLKSDLIVTHELYTYLKKKLPKLDWRYNDLLISPITPILVEMCETGVGPDTTFIESETKRLLSLMQSINDEHVARFGLRLDTGDVAIIGWIYRDLGCREIRTLKTKKLSLKSEHVRMLHKEYAGQQRDSLSLIHDYKLAQNLMQRLATLADYVDHSTQRIHSTFNDTQVSGRISSTAPSLQQIAAEVGPGRKREFISSKFATTAVHSRNSILARPGHWLVAFDIAQADVRVLAHLSESFPMNSENYLQSLHDERIRDVQRGASNKRSYARVLKLRRRQSQYYQPEFRTKTKCPYCWTQYATAPGAPGTTVKCPSCKCPMRIPRLGSQFKSKAPCQLADDFRRDDGDFYSVATETMQGRPPQQGTNERNFMKQTILGIVNGMSKHGLAKRLDISDEEASKLLGCFEDAYPKFSEFTKLMYESFAVTGEARTFLGRRRRVSTHRWMSNQPTVEIQIAYRGSDRLWLRVVPLRANRHVLTCWVLSAVDANYKSSNFGQEIYNSRTGRLSQRSYRIFEDGLVYRLPMRNVSWRIIRRVRTEIHESKYEGFDRTARSLFNHMAQGGTADIAKVMMLRSQAVCKRYGAQLVLQIHDELVFEVPQKRLWRFLGLMHNVLEIPPTQDFSVPIIVEPKIGRRFGEMKELKQRVPFQRYEWAWFRFAIWFNTPDRWITSLPY